MLERLNKIQYYYYDEMENPLFTITLPLIKTDKELERIMSVYSKYDPYFIASGCIKERKERFDKLWQKFDPYADKHFLKEIKTSFHQRTWEMYVGNVLLKKKFAITSKNEGPDFVVNDNLYIECVAPIKGNPTKPNSVPEMFIARKPLEMVAQDIPVDKMILRITQSLKDKALDQYKKWKTKPWFKENMPFIIAINTGNLEYPQDYLGIPLIIKALFGLQFLQISQNGDKNFSWRNEIQKGDGVPVTYFTNEKFKFVSGVIYSDKTVLNHPENIGNDCIFVNNPFAEYPTDKNLIQHFKNWKVTKTETGLNLQKCYE